MATESSRDSPGGDHGRVDGEAYSGVLAELSEATRTEFERRVREVRLGAGVVIFDAGEAGDALYLIRSGLVDVTTGDDTAGHLRTFGPGDFFGEQALLTGRPRSARATAQTGVTLWRLDHTDFLYLIGSDPHLGSAVARTLSERLTETNRRGTGSPRGQSVVLATSSAGDAAGLVVEFAAATAQLLGEEPVIIACGPAERWEGTGLPAGTAVHDPDGLAESAVHAVRQHGLVIVLCSSAIPPDVYGGADRVIIVGDAPVDLIRKRGHAPRVVATVAGKGDIGALAREVCGRRIGLALGSGGIRGWAHAGVISVLAEEGIPVDFVAGAERGGPGGSPVRLGHVGRCDAPDPDHRPRRTECMLEDVPPIDAVAAFRASVHPLPARQAR